MKRAFWILVTPAAIILSLMALSKVMLEPRLERWLLAEIQSYSQQNLPVEIRAQKFSLSFFRPSALLSGIYIAPKPELQNLLSPITVQSVRVNLDLFALISGQVKLSALVVDSVRGEINIDPLMESKGPPSQIPMDQIFQLAEKIPLQRLFVQDINLKLTSKKLNAHVDIQSGGLLLSNMAKNITAKVDISRLNFNSAESGDLSGGVDAHLYLTRQSLRIIQLGVRLDTSEVVARGELTNFKDILIRPTGLLDLSAHVKISDIYNEIKKTRPDFKIPLLDGELNTDVEIRFNGTSDVTATAELKTKKVVVSNFQLGDAKIEGKLAQNVISFSEVEVNHPAGKATLNNSKITLDKKFDFQSNVKLDSLDLQKLFVSMDLHNIPTGTVIQGQLPCKGQILEGFYVTCENAQLSATNLWVRTENKPKASAILELDKLSAKGKVTADLEQVSYEAQVAIGESQGTSDGTIKYAEGFKINYASPNLDFKDVRNLANLKFVGALNLQGSTEGHSDAATFKMKLNAKDFTFEDFYLGNLIGDLSYLKGHLLFDNLAGAINKTQYLGHVDVDLGHDKISGELSLPTADLADVAHVFDKLYRFPFQVSGLGAAKAKFSGPFSFWKMTYNLESQFKDVSVGHEGFDVLHFNVNSDGNKIEPQKVLLQKNSSTVTMGGHITSEQDLALIVDGKGWRMEESSILSQINSSLVGLLNFSGELKGKIAAPQVIAKGAITDTSLEDQDIPNSNFAVKIDRSIFSGDVSLFGDRVQGNFQLPFSKGNAPLMVHMTTRDWNYATLLAMVGGANLASEYESSLSANIDLRSESGDFFKSSGKVQVSQFFLKRGNLSFRNRKNMEMVADNGRVSLRNFDLDGPSNSIQIKGNGFTADNLDVDVNANMELRLMQIFLPFLEDLGGPLRMSASVSGQVTKPEILGSASLNNAFIKLKGFPHPIERIQSDVVFSHTKVLINSLRANMAGGTITGDGSVVISGIRKLPTSLRLHLENVSMNVPENVKTQGNAELLLSGEWFPFVLSGNYSIHSGLVEKEFTEESEAIAGVRQSIYLPKALKENRFEPIVLDLQLNLERSLQVRNSMIDGAVTGNLQVKGPPTSPILLGRITTEKKSKLIFKDKIFEVTNGVVQFNDPNELNPDLFVTAMARVNEYDITLLAQGSAKNPNIRLTSVPPLQEQDIISLIALGVTSSTLDQNVQSKNQAEQTGFEIGAAALAKPLSKQVQSTLGLNLQFTSKFDSTRNISVPKVTVSRNLSEKLKASGSRAVGDDATYDLKLEYQLNTNFTAVGSFENRATQENTSLQGAPRESSSIFGLDLEYKREFK